MLYCLFPKCIKAVRCKSGASKRALRRVPSWSAVQIALNSPSVFGAKHKLHFKSNILFGRRVLIQLYSAAVRLNSGLPVGFRV